MVRRLVWLALASFAAWAWTRFGGILLARADRALYPPLRQGPSRLAADIEGESLRRKENAFAIDYRRVTAMIDAARAQGMDVSALGPKLSRSAEIARGGDFSAARRFLNAVELQIPRRAQSLRPVTEQDLIAPEAEAAPARRRRRR